MKKKIICLLTATTLLVSNVCSVSVMNVCGGSTVFQNNKTRALATTYCSYATVSDYKVITVLHATDSGHISYNVSKTKAGTQTVQKYKDTENGKKWISASGEHYVYYRSGLNWSYNSVAPK